MAGLVVAWSLLLYFFVFAAAKNFTSEEDGPEKCLSSDAPVWCLVGETGLSLAKALDTDKLPLLPGVYLSRGTEAVGSSGSWQDLTSRSIHVDLAELTNQSSEEGRARRRKRKYAYILVAMATLAAVLVPFKLKAIAIMAATALMVAKLALVVASVVGLKKLVSKEGEETTHVHYGKHRSDQEAHMLAYNGQLPQDGY